MKLDDKIIYNIILLKFLIFNTDFIIKKNRRLKKINVKGHGGI